MMEAFLTIVPRAGLATVVADYFQLKKHMITHAHSFLSYAFCSINTLSTFPLLKDTATHFCRVFEGLFCDPNYHHLNIKKI